MIEKIKDILYDLSDIVVSLIIIAVIFVSVSWKISDTLAVDLTDTLAKPTTEADSTTPVTVIIPEIDPANAQNPVEPSSDENTPQSESSEPPSDNITPSSDDPEPSQTAPTDSPAPSDTASTVLNAFVVAEGATGYSIGEKLVSEGYVDNVNTFVNRLVALKLDNKLRAGTFKLSKSDDLDTIIKVLAGQGR